MQKDDARKRTKKTLEQSSQMTEQIKSKLSCGNGNHEMKIIKPIFDYLRVYCSICDPEKHHVILIQRRFKTVVEEAKEVWVTLD